MATCAMTREKRLASPAWEPKSYQCSARIPSGPGSLRRGMRFRVRVDELCDLEDKDVCDVVGQWEGWVWVNRVEARDLLDDVSGDGDWRGVSCCC